MENLGASEDLSDFEGPPPAPELAPAPVRKAAPIARPTIGGARPPANTDLVREMANEDDRSVRDWINSLAGDGEVRVAITRKRPTVGPGGENIGGVLETVEDRIDEEYIRDTWGGGDFQIKVNTLRPDGTWKYFRARTIKLAGPPKMSGHALGLGGAAPVALAAEHDGLAERAFQTMERNAREAQDRADRAENAARAPTPGLDLGALQALQQPMIESLRTAQETIANLQMQMLTLATKPVPKDDFRDKLLEQSLSGEGRRIEMLREQYEGRIDKLRDNFDDERKRAEDRHQAEIKRLEDRHERELKMYEKQSDASSKNTDIAFGARLESQKETISRLERELVAAAAKIATLESTKNQTITEKADELIKMKDALDGLGGGDDEKDSPWYKQVIDGLANSDAAVNWINKLSGGPPADQQAQQQQQMLPPPGIPFQTGDGNVYVRDAAGQVSMIDPATANRIAARARKRARRAANGNAAPAAADPGVEAADPAAAPGEPTDAELEAALTGEEIPKMKVRRPSSKELATAITFIENALRNGDGDDKVTAFAATARNLVPSDILAYIQSVGPDEFLNSARLTAGSPLTTIRGRGFLRKVFKYLVEGTL